MEPVSALTMAGSDSGGGAGIQADLKTFSAFEVHGLSVITSLTAQNTQGVEDISNISAGFIEKQIDAVMEDFDVKWAKTGMLSKRDSIETVLEKAKEYDLNLVVDPVMEAASGDSLLEKGTFGALKDLIGEAKLVTPNLNEASELANMKINSVEDMKDAAEKIGRFGPKNILIKGGHLDEPKIHNILLQGNNFLEYETERIEADNIHGTGCTFSAAITAQLAMGEEIRPAVKKAGDFMLDAVKRRLNIGEGYEVINPMARDWKMASGSEEIEEVQTGARKLVGEPKFKELIPEVGTNIAMAPQNAQRKGDVIGLTGRIIIVGERPHLTGIPAKGGSEHMANLVLSVMKHDIESRAAMNIKYSEKILSKCQDLGFEIGKFDREKEPDDTKTMKWGPDQVIEDLGEVPDIIYDEGAVGKEPMIRIIGTKATELSEKALKILKELEK